MARRDRYDEARIARIDAIKAEKLVRLKKKKVKRALAKAKAKAKA